VWALQQKVDDLERKLRHIEAILRNIDANAAHAVNLIARVDKKVR